MTEAKARVLVVGPFPPPRGGGVATFMLNVLGSYLGERYGYSRFTTSRPVKKNVVDNWGYAALVNAGPGRLLLAGLITAWHLCIYPFVVIARRIDLVQIQSSAWMTFWECALYVLMAKALGRPTLMRLGGETDDFYEASSPWAQRLIRTVLTWPSGLIVQSEYWRTFVAGLGRSDNVFVLGNFVDDSWLSARDNPENEVPLFLFSAGAEAKRKGLDELLEAITLLKDENVAVRFRIVAASEVIIDEISARGLETLVETKGVLGRNEMAEEFRDCDAFLLPSRAEGFPNALLEAMAAGLPVIVTPVGAIPEVVVDGEGGFIVPVGDVLRLKERIVDMASDASLRHRMGSFNRKLVAERYTAERVLPTLESAYRVVLV